MVAYSWEPIHPEGLASAMLGTTIGFTIVCLTVLFIRLWIRASTHTFAVEDYLMTIGVAINMAHNGIVIWGVYAGIGTVDSRLTVGNQMEAAKATVFWQLTYVSGSLLIKASICMQLARITTERLYRIILYVFIAITAITTFIAMLAVLIRCRPVSASWDPSRGTCIDQKIIIALTYAVSAANIATDWSVAILPIFILRNLKMRRKLKIMAGIVMGVGVLASIATIIRMPYSSAYSASKNVLYGIGNIVLWTVVECSLGIIAGCMPMLRKLFRSLSDDYSSNPYYHQNGDTNELVTIGRVSGRHNPIHDTHIEVTVYAKDGSQKNRHHNNHHNNSWSNSAGNHEDGGSDDSSTKNIINVVRSVDQTSSSTPGRG